MLLDSDQAVTVMRGSLYFYDVQHSCPEVQQMPSKNLGLNLACNVIRRLAAVAQTRMGIQSK